MTDFKITVDDQDALDGLNGEAASPTEFAGGFPDWTLEQRISEWVTRHAIAWRKEQIVAAANVSIIAAAQAFDDKQAAKNAAKVDAQPQPAPAE